MSVVVINAVTVPPGSREPFEARFRGRAGHVSKSEGFEAFELLRPTEGGRYLVYTRWRSQEDFDAWRKSTYFQEGHRQHHGEGPLSTESEVWVLEVLESEYAPD
jgi:heme-degrading monooxygenase HmoA